MNMQSIRIPLERYLVMALMSIMLMGVFLPISAQTSDLTPRPVSRQYDVLFHEALIQRLKGNLDASFDLLTRCLELRPDAAETYFYMGELYDQMANSEQAMNSFNKAFELEPNNVTFMERVAQSYIQVGEFREAAEAIERMYEADKGRQELLETLFELYMHLKDYDKAINALNLQETADGPNERISLNKCRIYIEQNDHERAISEMKSLADHYPNDPTYGSLYANTLLVSDHKEEAYDVLMKILAENPDNPRAQQVLHNYYLRQGDEEAADSVSHALLLNPKVSLDEKMPQLRAIIIENSMQGGDSIVVLNLFQEMLDKLEPKADLAEMKATYMELKKMPADSVRHALEYVLQLAPGQASARLRLVQQAWEDQDDERIISLCKAARQYNPEEMAFYYFQGMAYYRQNDTDHALEAFQNGINVINEQSNPDIVSDFYSFMGDLLYEKGREADAFAAYDSCLVWKEDNIGCLNNYAYYLSLQNKRLDEAEQMSYRTVKAEPNNATYLDTYAWILFMQKRYAEARIYIDQALQHDEQPSAVVCEHAGDIYALSGDIDAAVAQWQKALAEDPVNKLLKKKLKHKKYLKK